MTGDSTRAEGSAPRASRRRDAWICVALTLVTVIAFAQIYNHQFVHYDDTRYVVFNPHVQAGLTRDSIAWAFTTTRAEFWHPLTWLSLMLDTELWGTGPRGYHVTNLAFHVASTLILYLAFRRMTGAVWRSAFVAALFAIHPLHVESVAWVAERKDVLSGLFWVLTMWAYARYAARPGFGKYAPVVLFFVLGMMAKPMLVTLPFALLLLDFWPLGRLQHAAETGIIAWRSAKRVLLEKLPLFVLTALSCAGVVWARMYSPETEFAGQTPAVLRLLNIPVAYAAYIRQTVWPTGLTPAYPPPVVAPPAAVMVGSLLLLVFLTVVAVRCVRSHPAVFVGWLWYVGTLVPVSGIVEVGSFSRADRFTYVPLIGVFMMIAWGVPPIVARRPYFAGPEARSPGRPSRRLRRVLGASATAWVLVLMVCTWFQVGLWRDRETLFRHALAVTSDNFVAHHNLGCELLYQGRTEEAVKHLMEAARIKDLARTEAALGVALVELGEIEEGAVLAFEALVRLEPGNADARNLLGVALNKMAETNEAILQFRAALEIQPSHVPAHVNLGNALLKKGQAHEAVQCFHRALEFKPGHVPAHVGLGTVLLAQGNADKAILSFSHALKLDPDNAKVHNSLGVALASQGRLTEAIQHFKEALRLSPDHKSAQLNLRRAMRQLSQTGPNPG